MDRPEFLDEMTDAELDALCDDVTRETGLCPVVVFYPDRYHKHQLRKYREITTALTRSLRKTMMSAPTSKPS